MANPPARLVAHTPPSGGDWHYLDQHARSVADLAARFAAPFGGEDIAWWLGLLHDAGKAHPDFQAYLSACHREPHRRHQSVDHKTTGAAAMSSSDALAQIILGHHGGLSNLGATTSRLRAFIRNEHARCDDAWSAFTSLGIVPNAPLPPFPAWARATPVTEEFFVRMLFSCLVDADALDTEAHWTPDAADIRDRDRPGLPELWDRFQANQRALLDNVSKSPDADSAVNRVRADVYDACVERSALPPGFFRLTVPTGGGKTRSATAFDMWVSTDSTAQFGASFEVAEG